MFIDCEKHGKVKAYVTKNYNAFCPFCRLEGIIGYMDGMSKEERETLVKKVMAATSEYSMGCHVLKNKCSICDKDWKD